MIRVASHWKATIHIYNLKKFQKIQKFIAFTSACLESLNSTYGSPRPLGVNPYYLPYCIPHKCIVVLGMACGLPTWEKSQKDLINYNFHSS
jgi:hypothetical protein